MTLEITAVSKQAAHFFNDAHSKTAEFVKQFTNLEAITDTLRAELTSAKPVEPVPLFGMAMAGFAFAHVEHGDFTPSHGGGNSGRGHAR